MVLFRFLLALLTVFGTLFPSAGLNFEYKHLPIEFEVEQKFIAFKRKIERPMLNSAKQKARRERDYGER